MAKGKLILEVETPDGWDHGQFAEDVASRTTRVSIVAPRHGYSNGRGSGQFRVPAISCISLAGVTG